MFFTLSQFVFGWIPKNKGRKKTKTNNDNENEDEVVMDVVDEIDSESVRIVYLWTKKNCLVSGDYRSSLVKLTMSFV